MFPLQTEVQACELYENSELFSPQIEAWFIKIKPILKILSNIVKDLWSCLLERKQLDAYDAESCFPVSVLWLSLFLQFQQINTNTVNNSVPLKISSRFQVYYQTVFLFCFLTY